MFSLSQHQSLFQWVGFSYQDVCPVTLLCAESAPGPAGLCGCPGLAPVALSRRCSFGHAGFSCGARALEFVDSGVAVPGLERQARWFRRMGLAALWRVESSWIGNQTGVPCIGRSHQGSPACSFSIPFYLRVFRNLFSCPVPLFCGETPWLYICWIFFT